MLDVKQVQLQLPLGIFHGGAVLIFDLGPAGDPRTHGVPLREKIQVRFQQLAKIRLLRARPHQAHMALQNVEKLRQFVEPVLADKSPDAGNAIVIVRRPAGTGFFGVLPHGAELVDLKRLAVQTDALLPEEYGPSAFQQDGHRDQGHYRQGQGNGKQGRGDINSALGREQQFVFAKSGRKDQPTGRELLQRDAPADLLEDRMLIFHGDSGKLQPQQLAIRHAPTLLLEREHYAVNLFFLYQCFQFADSADDSRIHQRLADVFAFFIEKTEYLQIEVGPGADFARKRNSRGAGTDD